MATYDRHITKNEQSNLFPTIESTICCCDILISGNVSLHLVKKGFKIKTPTKAIIAY
jgi:hypothetical protein